MSERTGMTALLVAAALGSGEPAAAQVGVDGEAGRVWTDTLAAEAPFGPGERLTYRVRLGLVTVGEGYLEVVGVDSVRGHPSYHLRLGIDGSTLFGVAQIHDTFESWLDTRTLVSRRFVRDIHEMSYKSRRVFEIYPEEGRWERADEDKQGETPGPIALDEISFLFYARTLPLGVGEEYTLNRYFKVEGNPVRFTVLRKERIQVPAGTFDAIVVRPVIQTDGLFSEGGEAELYFTDDEHRHLILLRSKIPFVGSLTLDLTGMQTGVPLNPAARHSLPRPQAPGPTR